MSGGGGGVLMDMYVDSRHVIRLKSRHQTETIHAYFCSGLACFSGRCT